MDGYDLDDTLAAVNYKQAGFKNLSDIYASAPVIYTPDSPFVIITARSIRSRADKLATDKWVRENMPNCRKVYYVSGGDVDKQKADIVRRLHLASYTDNNSKHITAMKPMLPNVKFFLMQNGKRTPI
jgi:hypothetical protein